MRLSNVVTVFNKRPYISDLADSILMQDAGPVEVVFVDDRSTDGSWEETQRACARLEAAGHRTTHLRLPENCGPSVATNVGIRHAQGEWIFFIDADDMVAPGAANMMLGVAAACDADFIYGGKATFTDELPGPAKAGKIAVYDDAVWGMVSTRLVCPRFICRRELAAEGCDERIFVQDVSLPLRIANRSKRMVHLSAPAILQRKLPVSISSNDLQLVADFVGAAGHFLNDVETSRRSRLRLLRRCFRKLNKSGRRTWTNRFLWLLSGIKLAPAKAEQHVLREFHAMLTEGCLRRSVPKPNIIAQINPPSSETLSETHSRSHAHTCGSV